jgi:hypothetical protein
VWGKNKSEMSFFSNIIDVQAFVGGWQAFTSVWFIVLPPLFYFLFKLLWMDDRIIKYLKSLDYVLLEIIPPRELEKSPKLMELVYSGLSGIFKNPNAKEEFIDGYISPRFSLELVGDEQGSHIFVRTPKSFQALVEANFYAQYPDIEIRQVPDYVDNIPKVVPNKDWDLWGTDFELVKPDAYPIKTYKNFEEDITGKMIDPLSSIFEVMGKLPNGQRIWFQLVIYPEKDAWADLEGRNVVNIFTKRVSSKKKTFLGNIVADIFDVLSNVLAGIFGGTTEFSSAAESKDEAPLEFRLTPVEKQVLTALEENIGKSVFKVKMRFIYIGKREGFDRSFLSSFVGGIKQFNDNNLNAFKPNEVSKTYATYLFKEPRLLYRQRKILRRYKDRDMDGAKFILSTAELATMFHLPDMSVVAPSLTRIESRRGGAPSNLPIE